MMYKFLLIIVLSIASSRLAAQSNSINEEAFISIGGIEQWVTISGEDKSKPVILFLHDGPGSTMSQYDDAAYGYWKKDFVLVNWDQRGAGRTFGKNAPEEVNEDYWIENPLTVEQMTNDGIELTKYLINHLNKKKVILVGTSWGSLLGVKMALSNPELFYAYVGHSQLVKFSDNILDAFNTKLALAKKANNTEDIQNLETLGAPPYKDAKNYGQLLRVVKKYERINSTAPPENWFKISSEYDYEKDTNHRYEGDDYSFIHFVGHEKLGIKSMLSNIDFNKDALNFDIPIYFIQGEEDILTSKEINKPYFDKIKAPKKEYYVLPNSAHGHNQSVIDKQYEVVKNLELN